MRVILKGEKHGVAPQACVASLHHCADNEARFMLHPAHSKYSVCRRLHLHAAIKRTL
ncbi:hypothetical protein CBM2634_B10021 [Cupriavidus taiwanensis]|uniref:Uncharacterized protein n=1 Tax=Cupriavidus taiwanensis TaxID=164546 RepID=A0A375J4Q6_9BURK|nr:hypothetical protein CBM2634_B10021 [Cupriavidus taiwanensis]